jgi:hypothetical protein
LQIQIVLRYDLRLIPKMKAVERGVILGNVVLVVIGAALGAVVGASHGILAAIGGAVLAGVAGLFVGLNAVSVIQVTVTGIWQMIAEFRKKKSDRDK